MVMSRLRTIIHTRPMNLIKPFEKDNGRKPALDEIDFYKNRKEARSISTWLPQNDSSAGFAHLDPGLAAGVGAVVEPSLCPIRGVVHKVVPDAELSNQNSKKSCL